MMTMSDATVYVSYENGVVEVDDDGDLLGICIGYSAETEKLVSFTPGTPEQPGDP